MAVEGSGAPVELTLAIRDVTLAVQHYRLRAARAGFGVGATEMMVLSQLFTVGPSSPTALARFLSITTASITDVIDRLEGVGHVTRRPHPTDRRKIIIELAPATRERIAAMFAIAGNATARAAEFLTRAEQASICEFLRRVALEYDRTDPTIEGPGTPSSDG